MAAVAIMLDFRSKRFLSVFFFFFFLSHISPIRPTKFRVIWHFGSGDEAQNRFQGLWISSWNDLAIFLICKSL